MRALDSRKLVGVIVAIAGIVGIDLGLAVIVPEVLDKDVIFASVTLIAGLGGFQVYSQAKVDERFAG